jgi:tetratricopeptide (TPR) repeat protein
MAPPRSAGEGRGERRGGHGGDVRNADREDTVVEEDGQVRHEGTSLVVYDALRCDGPAGFRRGSDDYGVTSAQINMGDLRSGPEPDRSAVGGTVTARSAAAEFAAALKDLYEQAGNPTYAALVHQAAGQRPPVTLNEKSLSDWFTGKSVPKDSAAVWFLVTHLRARAEHAGHRVPAESWWVQQRARAWQERHADRGGRPTTRDLPRPDRQERAGRPVSEHDPLVLEIHRAITPRGEETTLPPLPPYIRRPHDDQLREAADQVANGMSRWVTVVGGSSTGKTRACWELARYLDEQEPGRWWLWHPYDPTRPDAAAAAIDQAGPYTIVWLNEAQSYLAPADERQGERIAAGLRTLLQDRNRRPVLVLATLWPEHWSALTTRPSATEPDPYAQARELLKGTAITLPDVFTPGELAGLHGAGVDPRLRQAAAHAEGGRVTQYLAGAPELEERYRTAPPAARAILHVAMDAGRYGHPGALPHALLEQAAPDYLDDHDWDALGEGWLEQALAYTATPRNGIRGPLTRIRPRPGTPHPEREQPCYRLADYLDQIGRVERADVVPPASFWTAATSVVTDPRLLRHLGRQAEVAGEHNHAVRLFERAADQRDTFALSTLAQLRVQAGDEAGAVELFKRAGLYALIEVWDQFGRSEDAAALRQYVADYLAGTSSVDSGAGNRDDPAADVGSPPAD